MICRLSRGPEKCSSGSLQGHEAGTGPPTFGCPGSVVGSQRPLRRWYPAPRPKPLAERSSGQAPSPELSGKPGEGKYPLPERALCAIAVVWSGLDLPSRPWHLIPPVYPYRCCLACPVGLSGPVRVLHRAREARVRASPPFCLGSEPSASLIFLAASPGPNPSMWTVTSALAYDRLKYVMSCLISSR